MADGRCRPCRKIYMKKLRADEAGKIKASKRAWNLLNAEKVKAQNSERCKKWRANNREKSKQRAYEWAKANPEKTAEAKSRWMQSNRKKHNINVSAWSKRNRPAKRIHWQNYKARKLAAGGTFTKQDIKEIFNHQNGVCAICRVDISLFYHIDHIMPLSLGGSNGKENIQLLCPPCNLHKGAKHPDEYMSKLKNVGI